MTEQSETVRIVVGVDGSAGSRSALRWALTQAQLTGASVEAITTWQDPAMYAAGYGTVQVRFDDEGIAEIMTKVLDDTVAEVVGEFGRPIAVRTHVVQGHPAQALLDAAQGAALLVLGTRGHSTLSGLLLGSVSLHCVHHAPCPVVVVPR